MITIQNLFLGLGLIVLITAVIGGPSRTGKLLVVVGLLFIVASFVDPEVTNSFLAN